MARFRDRVRSWFGGRPSIAAGGLATLEAFEDLPLRRDAADQRRHEALTLTPTAGVIDNDDYAFRRLSSGVKFARRDLSPMAQDRMLEIAWYLYEQNPFARRLITCMTDLVVGEGLGFDAEDAKILEAGQKVWQHPINKLGERARELHNALALNGELILPVAVNDVSGVPTIGYIDPYQVERIELRVDNVLVPEYVVLKKTATDQEQKRIKIVAQDPLTGRLDGECFYLGINKLPNSGRGRSDFLPLGDWLDLFDQYMFAEVERVRLLSAFVWDLQVTGANAEQIAARVNEIGTPQSGSVFAHNENETLEAASPTLNATDRSETAKLLTIHITGSLGMPISWFGWTDSNRATIEGQNDVAMKTPAARQKEFASFLNLIVRFGIEHQQTANAVLFRDLASDKFSVTMPEIAAKDIARVGAALGAVVAALDAAMQNRTMSRRAAAVITAALTKHLGAFDFKAQDLMDEADEDAEERQQIADEAMASAAAIAAKATVARGVGPAGKKNPPIGPANKVEGHEADLDVADLDLIPTPFDRRLEQLEDGLLDLARRPATPGVTVHAPVTVNNPAPLPPGPPRDRTIRKTADGFEITEHP
jgi:hypothetical protein